MQIREIANQFPLQGSPVGWKSFGQGHINRTYCIETDAQCQYILQRINQYVFRQPLQLMENIIAVTEYLRGQDNAGQVLQFLKTRNGTTCFRDSEGEYWRMYHFIPGKCMEQATHPQDLYKCGLGFGHFQKLLANFPAKTLHETIPNFHHTPQRFLQFRESVQADAAGRKQEVTEEIQYLMSMETRAGSLQQMLEAGKLPLRVTHNDTNLSNLLFDDAEQPICVLDLDTVMPGLAMMDFADAIRSGASTAPEDEADLGKISLDLDRFSCFAKGFLEAATTLTPSEVQSLAESALVITLEQAARFLKDHLDGDMYYHIDYPGHNLVRARAQIKLAQDMQAKMDQMNQIVRNIWEKNIDVTK